MTTRIEKMIEWAVSIAKAKYGYSQNANLRWGKNIRESDGKYCYDCSAFCITALKQVGFDIDTSQISYTGNMYKLKNIKGLKYLEFNRNNLQRGDIVYYHKSGNIGHVAMYLGNGQMVEAKGTKWGVVVSNFYYNNWQYIVRVEDNYTIEEKDKVEDMNLKRFPDLKKGDNNVYVGIAQVLLKRYIDDTIEVDNSYGSHTQRAVAQFYKNCGYPASGEISTSFWDLAERSLKLWD